MKSSILNNSIYGSDQTQTTFSLGGITENPTRLMTKPTDETDPTGRNPHEPGAKLDGGKAPVNRGFLSYFPRAARTVALVSLFGANKYAWKGWETVPDGVERYADAMVRHLTYEGEGEVLDPDSGLLHAAHTCWNACARLELILRQMEEQK